MKTLYLLLQPPNFEAHHFLVSELFLNTLLAGLACLLAAHALEAFFQPPDNP